MNTQYFEAAIERISSHPAFVDAVSASARSSIELHAHNRLSNWVLSDRARALFPFVLFYLDAGGEADFTVTRVRELCERTSICSAGRAGAMLALLRFGGMIVSRADPADRRIRRLSITDKLRELQRARLAGQLAAVAAVYPEVAAARPLLGDATFERNFWLALGRIFVRGFRVLHYADLELFAERSCGMILLYSLMLSGDGVPPQSEIAVRISALSRRFGISRAHIARLLRDAEAAGFIVRSDAQHLHFTPKLQRELMRMFAALFLFVGHAAHVAMWRTRGKPVPADSSYSELLRPADD